MEKPMPRTARIIIDGGTYHVLTRGNNGQPVFHGDPDFQRYLQVLSTYAREHHLKVYHFALMPNQVHLVLEVARGASLSKAMLGLNLTYALYYRKRYRYSGHLWQGRFKSLLIDQAHHLLACGRYVETQPVRAGLVKDPGAYPWSSYRTYAIGAESALLCPPVPYAALGMTAAERQHRYRQFVQEGLVSPTPPAPRLLISNQSHASKSLEEVLGLRIPRGSRGRPRTIALSAE
jgi:putative transposase